MTTAGSRATINEYPIGVFTSVYTGKEAFLADHIIQGNMILPGMAYLEIARAAVANSIDLKDGHMLVLKDSVFVNALLVTEPRTVDAKVYPGHNGEFGVEVSTDLGVHFQTKVYVEETLQPDRIDIEALRDRCQTQGLPKAEFYQYFNNRDVRLGPSHRGVESITLGENCGLVKVKLAGSSRRGMAMDPGMLDSIIQGGVALASKDESNVVPFGVVKTQIFSPLIDEMYVFMEKVGRGLDYTVMDAVGNIKVVINGFLTREIDLSSQAEQLNFYKPSWYLYEHDSNESRASENITVIRAEHDYNDLVSRIFETAKTLIQNKTEGHLIEVKIPENTFVWRGIIAALKTINIEYPKIECRLMSGGKIVDSKYQNIQLDPNEIFGWPDNKTILITGGLGGLGLLIAEDVVKNSDNCTLILIGRKPPNSNAISTIERLRNGGDCKIIVAQCDVTNKRNLKKLIEKHPEINGVIHASGLINDKLIKKKSFAEIEEVLAPKVQGLEHLDQATANLKLDYFITFSSIAGAIGNEGQFDYAAANGYMDSFIDEREEKFNQNLRHGKSISINWPLWDSAGMQIDDATKENLQRVFKIKPLPSEVGLTALKQTMASEHQRVAVVFGNKKSVGALFDSSQTKPKKIKQNPSLDKSDKLSRAVAQEVKIQIGEHLKRNPNELEETADWAEFGFDSILMSSFVNRLNNNFSLNLMPTVLFEANNMQLFSQYLLENHNRQMVKIFSSNSEKNASKKNISQKPNQTNQEIGIASIQDLDQNQISTFAQGFKKSYRNNITYRDKDIAIVGMSCKIAGATDAGEFWQMLEQEKDMVSEIPEDRWDWRDYPGVSKWGSFITDVDKFDSLFFGIAPAEAMYMTPEQRLMMEYVWECLENAGCGGEDIKSNNTGLFVGCGPSGYCNLLHDLPVEAYSATGTVSSVGPNRISYFMDWHGPSNPIDTACSSALVAMHRGVEAIRAGHCDQAVIGGVNLLLEAGVYVSFSKSGMLSEDGRCKTFSDQANGYVRGEGVGMLLIKSLKKALQDGNMIHALVKGTAENHGGRTTSLTAPNPKSQASVIKRAIQDADIDFSRISYIECHGTGTELGDPVEINGLKLVAKELVEDKDSTQVCKLGSIKSNIGHLEYGAGVVGLIKVILQMKNKKIAKTLHCDQVSPYIDLAGTPYEIAQETSEWHEEPGLTRVAGISSFGFGGVNAHVILEEFPEIEQAQEVPNQDEEGNKSQILTFSARSEEILIDYIAQIPEYIEKLDKDPLTLKRIAYTLQVGRMEMSERCVFIVNSLDEWAEQVSSFLQQKGKGYNRKIYRGTVKASATENIEISDTQAGRGYLQQLVDSNETEKLAELWVKGTKIDWQQLHH
jgi:polyketide synthase PksN